MANYNSLKATIDAQIKANGVQAITGPILNAVLTAMINTIGNGYTLQGSVAQTTDNPGAPDNPVAYLAAGPGTYTNFGGTVIPNDGHAYLLTWDTSWHAVQLPLATFDLANGKQDALTFDDAPTPGSDNPVKSSGIAEALDDKQDKDPGATAGHVAVMDGDGNSVDGGKALSNLATKEDVEAVEQEVAQVAGEAGLAEAVIDTDGAGTEQEFTFRKSGGDGGAYYRKIKGKTIAWNQGIEDWNFSRPELWSFYGGTLVINSNKATFTKDSGEGSAVISTNYIFVASHNYRVAAKVKASAAILLRLSIAGGSGAGFDYQQNIQADQWVDVQGIISNANGAYSSFYIVTNDLTEGQTLEVEFVNITDLTLAGMPDITASEFLALYPGYHEFNPGTLVSNDAEAVETTGVNQWDEEWEEGALDSTTGGNSPSSTQIRSKNYIPVIPNTVYYRKNPYSDAGDGHYNRVAFYDSNKNFLGASGWDSFGGNNTFTTPNNAAYMRFCVNASAYTNDICINLSNPAINGQYFPYWKRTLQLGITTRKDTDGNVPFADGMKGAGTASDWCDKVGGEKRMGRLDLGSLEWFDGSQYYPGTIYTRLTSSPANNNIICQKYITTNDPTIDKSVVNASSLGAGTLWLHDSDITLEDIGAEGIVAKLNGVFLDYEIATPVPFTWAEPLNLGVKVDENGTERAVAPEGATAPSAPFVADTTYTMSIARMVAKLQTI